MAKIGFRLYILTLAKAQGQKPKVHFKDLHRFLKNISKIPPGQPPLWPFSSASGTGPWRLTSFSTKSFRFILKSFRTFPPICRLFFYRHVPGDFPYLLPGPMLKFHAIKFLLHNRSSPAENRLKGLNILLMNSPHYINEFV